MPCTVSSAQELIAAAKGGTTTTTKKKAKMKTKKEAINHLNYFSLLRDFSSLDNFIIV